MTESHEPVLDIEPSAPAPNRRRVLRYSAITAGIVVWAVLIVIVAATLIPVDHYLISYYIADYTFGFVRRGLAGELVGTVSDADFFADALAMRWILTSLYLVSLAALAYTVLRKGFSERRVMVALLIPVLPFGVPYAVYSARPDLLGAAAVIALSLALALTRGPRSAITSCAAYGVLVGLLALMHEGIAFEFALGALLAILVLAQGLTPSLQRWCAVLAVGPGLVAALFVALVARHDVSGKICALVPHEMMTNPFEGATTASHVIDNIFGGQPAVTDYHDWVCGWYLSTYDYGIGDGIREVLAIGAPGLVVSFLLGLVVIAVTIGALQYFSGVPFAGFVDRLRGNLIWVLAGVALMVPVFMTGIDWTRWLLVIAFNMAVVFVLYLRDKPELDEPPPPRTARLFVLVVLAFAFIPLGLVPGGPIS